ncbi:hypothetical protein [Shewanella psychrotolerans]|uniref:hypothetical protein n=1 Tax=Shewanella psychrotolerans TaxID=2864206 RepID=UPI0021ABE67B|nr:hypothetical protein [Shewanella psychrotolerans]
MAGLLSIQNLTQNAGFGIETAATNTTLILVENASLTFNSHHQKLTTPGTLVPIKFSAQTGNAIFWEENTTLSTNSNEYHCKGILSDINTKAVYALTASNSCSPIATLWSNQNWDITRIIKPDVLDAPLTITASLDVGKCSPFESEVSKSLLESQISELAGIESDAQIKAGLKISVGWSKAASYTPWTSCLTNFSG